MGREWVGKVEFIREGVRPQAERRRCRHAKRAGASSSITIWYCNINFRRENVNVRLLAG